MNELEQKFLIISPSPNPPPPKGRFQSKRADSDEIWYVSSLGVYEWVATKIFDESLPFPLPTPKEGF